MRSLWLRVLDGEGGAARAYRVTPCPWGGAHSYPHMTNILRRLPYGSRGGQGVCRVGLCLRAISLLGVSRPPLRSTTLPLLHLLPPKQHAPRFPLQTTLPLTPWLSLPPLFTLAAPRWVT